MFPWLPVFSSFLLLSSDLWGSSSHLRASNTDLMVIACLSPFDRASKPQYIIHMCILNHFPNEHFICSTKENHVSFISVFLFFFFNSFSTLRHTVLSDSERHIVAWNKMFKHRTQMLLIWCLSLYAGILFNHCLVLLSYYYSSPGPLLKMGGEHMHSCVRAHKHRHAHLCLKKSKRFHSPL